MLLTIIREVRTCWSAVQLIIIRLWRWLMYVKTMYTTWAAFRLLISQKNWLYYQLLIAHWWRSIIDCTSLQEMTPEIRTNFESSSHSLSINSMVPDASFCNLHEARRTSVHYETFWILISVYWYRFSTLIFHHEFVSKCSSTYVELLSIIYLIVDDREQTKTDE